MSSGPPPGFFVSNEKSMIDLDWVMRTVLGTYFGYSRSRENFEYAVRNSYCFGVYLFGRARPQQVGFARVITDFASMGWLCDVVIDPSYRHQRLGHFLLQQIMNDQALRPLSLVLMTRDAQSLYREFGFSDAPMMIREPAGIPKVGG